MLLGIAFFTRLETDPRGQWDSFLESQHANESFTVLVQSGGVPANWTANNPPFVVGLSDSPYVLSEKKLIAFTDWYIQDENAVKQAMGFTRDQSIRLRVLDLGGAELFSAGSPASVFASMSRYQSFGLLSGKTCVIQLEVWNS